MNKDSQLVFDLCDPTCPPKGSGLPEASDDFPVGRANQLAKLESYNKHLFRPNTYLHKWWARRCGTTFRHILKHFVEDGAARDFYCPGGLEGRIVLDPMMGGGTTLHEAIRMGANVIGCDIDPIPVLQARATLNHIEMTEMVHCFNGFLKALQDKLGFLFRTECPACHGDAEMQFVLHGVQKQCDCGAVLMVESLVLRRSGKDILAICPLCGGISTRHDDCSRSGSAPFIFEKKTRKCEKCNSSLVESYDVPFFRRYRPVAIIGTCPTHGRFCKSPAPKDLALLEYADNLRSVVDLTPAEDFAVLDGPKSADLHRRGIRSYLDLFSSRQLLYLSEAIRLLKHLPEVPRLNISLLVSTSLEFNSMMCGYKGSDERAAGAIRHTFGLHAYCFQYTVAENNPVYSTPASGNLHRLFRDRIVHARKWATCPVERLIESGKDTRLVKIAGEVDGGEEVCRWESLQSGSRKFMVFQGDSNHLPLPDDFVDLIVTDPPYFDNVQYSDLAAFFRVWLRRLLPTEVDWTYDASESAVADGSNGPDGRFGEILGGIFRECARVLKPTTGRVAFTFHHWDPNAWAQLTLALQCGNLSLLEYFVVASENPISAHIRNLRSLTHDCVLILAPRSDEETYRWSEPLEIDDSCSEEFCRGCGAAVGWFLSVGLDANDVKARWRTLMERGRVNGKRTG